MKIRTGRIRDLLMGAALATSWACTDEPAKSAEPTPEPGTETPCVGKCDSADSVVDTSRYTVDLEAANAIWASGGPKAETLADLYTVAVKLPNGMATKAPTHLFGGPVVPVPYHDDDGPHVVDAKGQVIFQGDRELARFFGPDDIGYAIKHHRPESRILDFGQLAAGASADALKEDLKLQDTHIELVVGVMRPVGDSGDLKAGVITLNNPQGYQDGRFGDEVYSMVFVKPAYPDYLPAALQASFRDNIRTMMLGFNAVSKFPGDYNGGDPLAASTPDKVRFHTAQMVKAITGDSEARAWFRDPANMIYCAELAHVATSAGVLVPLNKAGLVDSGLVDDATYAAFAQLVDAHNNGEATPFTDLNSNQYAQYVWATMADEDLKALPAYGADAGETEKLGFRPLTIVEIVEGFLKTHLPRQEPALGGEALAPVQAAVLVAMKPALYETMGIDTTLHDSIVTGIEANLSRLTEDLTDPELDGETRARLEAEQAQLQIDLEKAKAVQQALAAKQAGMDAFFDQLVGVIGTSYSSYDEFRATVAPLLAQARTLASPRGEDGNGFFVPPSALHLIAQKSCDGDDRCGGLLGLDYVGHGIHLSAIEVQQAPPPVSPTAIIGISSAIPRPGTDYNGDGSVDVRDDEVVYLSNIGDKAGDLSGWTLSDKVGVRFEFPAGATIDAAGAATVYGKLEAVDATNFSADGLGLNDRGDELTLRDAEGAVIDVLRWDTVDVDQQVVTGDFE